MQDKKMINIPSQIRLKTEFFDGYGVEELVKTISYDTVCVSATWFLQYHV